jgi:hypothetical protein
MLGLAVFLAFAVASTPANAQEECQLPASESSAVERMCAVSDGLVRFRIGGLWGYLDRMGRVVIEPQFGEAMDFLDGAAAVAREEKWGLIDRRGAWLVEPRFASLDSMSHGLAVAEEDGKSGYIDRTGRWIIPPQFYSAGPFNETSAVASMAYQQDRLIDRTGRVIKAFPNNTSVSVYPNSAGLYQVRVQGARTFRRVDGQMMAYPDSIESANRASDGLIVATRKAAPGESSSPRWGAVDLQGRWVVDAKFAYLESFQAGLAIAQQPDASGATRYGLIDKRGQFVAQPEYALITRSERGWYRARLTTGAERFLAESGKRIATFECGEATEASSVSLGDASRWSVVHGCGQTWIIDAGRSVFRSQLTPTDVQATATHVLVIHAPDSSGDEKRPMQFELFDATGKRVLSHEDVKFKDSYDSIVLVNADPASVAAPWQRTPLALLIRSYERIEVVTHDYKILRDGGWQYESEVGRYGYASAAQHLQGPLPLKAAGGWGAIDAEGRWVVPPRYRELSTFRDGIAFAVADGRELVVDQEGREYAFPEEGRGFTRVAPRLLVGRADDDRLVRYDLTTGKIALSANASGVDPSRFYQGRAAFTDREGKHGLIDTAGAVVVAARFTAPIEPMFDDGSSLSGDSRHLVGWRTSETIKTDRGQTTLYGWIDTSGVERLKPQFDELRFDRNARLLVGKRDMLEGVYALDGATQIERRFASIEYQGDGWYATLEPELNGLVDANGNWVVEPSTIDLSDDRDGRFRPIMRDGEMMLIDARGRTSTRAKPLRLTPDDPSQWWTSDAYQSYESGTEFFGVDFVKRLRVPGIVQTWQSFSEGVLAFQPLERTEQHNVGLVESTGKVLGLYSFYAIEPMRAGFARFQEVSQSKKDPETSISKSGFLNRAGKIAVAAKFDAANDFVDERATVVVDGNLGMIDIGGRVLVSGAWLCGDKPVLVDGAGAVVWPAAARGVTGCN